MRLIDVDAVLDGLAHKLGIRSLDYLTKQEETIVGWFENAPTIDAVPVIRCRDCIYWWESHEMCKRNKDKNHHCACMNCDADFFCKNAERRTDATD